MNQQRTLHARFQLRLRRLLAPVGVAVLILASCARLSTSLAGPAASGGANDHDRFAVLDVKIGMVATSRAGFVCAKPSGNTGREDTHCVKFLDSRCANKPSSISVLKYGEDAGAGCHYDPSTNATRLDNKLMQ